MAKNIIQSKVEEIEDPIVKEVLRYVLQELDRAKSLPPTTDDPKNIAVIVNKLTRNL